jgi:Lrp/AsnC family transcriptional regulator for asnA, asnC and gidA
MDEIDVKILKILIKDARTPFSKIGKILGISKDRVKRRYEKIKQKNPNLKSSVILDLEKIGFKGGVGICIKESSVADHKKIIEKILNYPRITNVTEVVGDWNVYFDILVEDFNNIYELNEFLCKIEGIESMNIFFYPLNIDDDLSFFYMNDQMIIPTMK